MEQTLNTFVVSASVTNASSPIKGLDEDVKIVLQHLAPNTVGPAALKNTTNCASLLTTHQWLIALCVTNIVLCVQARQGRTVCLLELQ